MKAFFTKIAVLLAACLAATAFVACDDTKEEEGGGTSLLKATPLDLEFKAAGETLTVAVQAENVEWTASTTTEWLTLADNSGTGDGVMKVTARANGEAADRTGTITLTGKGVDPVTINVEQEGVPSIATNVKDLTFTCGDYYTKTILVEAEGASWKAATEADWIELTEQHEPDSNDGTVTVAVKKNTGAERTAVITLTAEGVEPAKITVTQQEAFQSELIGVYAPYIPDPSNPIGSLFITPTYAENVEEPTVDVSFLLGVPLPISAVTEIAGQLVGGMYAGGLVGFEFRDDGTVAAQYRLLEGFSMEDGATFSEETYEYPNAETLEVLPADVIRYYTENGKVYVTVDKAFLRNSGSDEASEDLTVLIDGMLEQYPALKTAIVSTETYYALPLKYEMKADGVVKLYMDKEMMLPFVPLLSELVDTLVPAEITMQMDPNDPQTAVTIPVLELVKSLLDGLFAKSETLEIGVELVKQV